jgi:hypothetical protein
MKYLKLFDVAKIKLPVDGFTTVDNIEEKLNEILEGKSSF